MQLVIVLILIGVFFLVLVNKGTENAEAPTSEQAAALQPIALTSNRDRVRDLAKQVINGIGPGEPVPSIVTPEGITVSALALKQVTTAELAMFEGFQDWHIDQLPATLSTGNKVLIVSGPLNGVAVIAAPAGQAWGWINPNSVCTKHGIPSGWSSNMAAVQAAQASTQGETHDGVGAGCIAAFGLLNPPSSGLACSAAVVAFYPNQGTADGNKAMNDKTVEMVKDLLDRVNDALAEERISCG